MAIVQQEQEASAVLGQEAFRMTGYDLIDFVTSHLYHVRKRHPYRPVPEACKQTLMQLPLPLDGVPSEEIVALFEQLVVPNPTFGTGHPKGFAWIGGGPSPMGVLGSLLAATLNPNCVGGNQSATYVELTVIRWIKELLGFPMENSAGLLVSGGSQATLIALMAARQASAERRGWNPRTEGLQKDHPSLVLYASDQAHHSVQVASELLGLGSKALHLIPSDDTYHINLSLLQEALHRDREQGLQPCCVVANAGTTNTGAIDPLAALADLCEQEDLWLHIDGAYGAVGRLDARIAPRLRGMERADSLAFDLHKWPGVPYEAGCLLVKERQRLEAAFAGPPPAYLETLTGVRFANFGNQLSRNFRALPVWMTLMELGQEGLGELVTRHNTLARFLAALVDADPDLERLAPVELSTVVFRYAPSSLVVCDGGTRQDHLNQMIMQMIQQEGEVFLSGTMLRGHFALRACIQHRETTQEDIQALLAAVRRAARQIVREQGDGANG